MYTVIRSYMATLQRVKWFLRLKRPHAQFEPAAKASVSSARLHERNGAGNKGTLEGLELNEFVRGSSGTQENPS